MNLSEAFQALDDQAQLWASSGYPEPRETYWGAMADVLDAIADPREVSPWHHEPAERALRYWAEFLPRLLSGDATSPTGHLLEMLRAVRDARQEVKRPTESPMELAALPGMTEQQIAATMGWDAERARQFFSARKAKMDGNAYEPKHLERPAMTPEERGRIQDAAKAHRLYMTASINHQQQAAETPAGDPQWKPPGPNESIEILLQMPGMTVGQICDMHRCTPADVEAVQRAIGQDAEAISPATVRAEIVAYHEADPEATPDQLAEALGVSVETVQEVLDGTLST